jgi:hypothetical protein
VRERERERKRERERLVNILKICYERDTFHGARQPDVKNLNDNNNNNNNNNNSNNKK